MKYLFTLALVAVVCFPFSSRAQSTGQTKSAGVSGKFEAFMSAGSLGISASGSQYDIAPGFQMVPVARLTWLQAGGEMVYQKISYRNGGTSNFMVLAGPTVNLGGATSEAFFVSMGGAIRGGSTDVVDPSTTDPNGFGFYFFAGKRFPIAAGFSLRTSLGVLACGTTGMVFRPFAVSYHF